MKRFTLILFSLILFGSAYSQFTPQWTPVINNDQRIRSIWPQKILMLPSDTLQNKLEGSFSYLNGVLYYKDATKWASIVSGYLQTFMGRNNVDAVLTHDDIVSVLGYDPDTLATRHELQLDSIYLKSQIDTKLYITDTVAMLAGYARLDRFIDSLISVQGRMNAKLDISTAASTYVPKTTAVNGHALSSDVTVSASDLTTGTLPDARLSTNVTVQGNTFNGNNQLLLLDAGGKVPFANLPAALMIYKGTWNAATNTPTLSDGTGVSGWVYIVSTGGTANLGSGSITLSAGDYLIHNGSTWQRSVGTNNVASVNGQQGVVVLNTSHISESGNLYYTDTRARAAISEIITGIDYSSGVFSLTSGYVIPTTTEETNWNTAYSNRITSLTTTGSSGAATLVSNVLNVPNYTIAGLGGMPTANPSFTGTLTGPAITTTSYITAGSIRFSASGYLQWYNGSTWQNVLTFSGTNGTDVSGPLTGLSGNFSSTFSAASFTGAGTGLTGTASSLSIGGNAATATNSTQWNSQTYGGVYSSGSVAYILAYNATNSRWEATDGGTIASAIGLTTSNWVDLTTDNQSITGRKLLDGSTTRLYIQRPSTSTYNGIEYLTNNVGKWFVGLRENLTSDNFIYYSEVTGHDVITANVSTDDVTLYNTLHVGGLLTPAAGIQMGGQSLSFDESGVRSWSISASSGKLNFSTGDGNGAFSFTNSTASTSTTTGALVVTGGVGVGGALNAGSSVTASSLIKSGGTSSQLLAADGSVVTAGTNVTISGGTISASAGTSLWKDSSNTIVPATGYGNRNLKVYQNIYANGIVEAIGGFTTSSNFTFGYGGGINLYNPTGASVASIVNNGSGSTNYLVFGNNSPSTTSFEFQGKFIVNKFSLAALSTAPSSASDTGTTGEIRWDANYMYVCTATNTWKRVAVATW